MTKSCTKSCSSSLTIVGKAHDEIEILDSLCSINDIPSEIILMIFTYVYPTCYPYELCDDMNLRTVFTEIIYLYLKIESRSLEKLLQMSTPHPTAMCFNKDKKNILSECPSKSLSLNLPLNFWIGIINDEIKSCREIYEQLTTNYFSEVDSLRGEIQDQIKNCGEKCETHWYNHYQHCYNCHNNELLQIRNEDEVYVIGTYKYSRCNIADIYVDCRPYYCLHQKRKWNLLEDIDRYQRMYDYKSQQLIRKINKLKSTLYFYTIN